MSRIFALAALLLVSHLGVALAGERPFQATAFEYNVNASPQISSRTFNCKINFFVEGIVKVIEIKSFLSKRSDPDVIVKVVSSNDTAASMIYNKDMEPIASYPRGQYVNDNLMLFTGGDEKRQVTGSWYTDPDYLMSDFAIRDANGALLYKETVIYTAKSPSR